MHPAEDRWLDEEAGAVVRPYALTRGRTRAAGGRLDLIALISAVRDASATELSLGPEHLALLRICRRPTSVADLAADLDLPVGVDPDPPRRPARAGTDPRPQPDTGGPAAGPAHPPRGRGWPSPPLSRPTDRSALPVALKVLIAGGLRRRQDDPGGLGQRDPPAVHRGGAERGRHPGGQPRRRGAEEHHHRGAGLRPHHHPRRPDRVPVRHAGPAALLVHVGRTGQRRDRRGGARRHPAPGRLLPVGGLLREPADPVRRSR